MSTKKPDKKQKAAKSKDKNLTVTDMGVANPESEAPKKQKAAKSKDKNLTVTDMGRPKGS